MTPIRSARALPLPALPLIALPLLAPLAACSVTDHRQSAVPPATATASAGSASTGSASATTATGGATAVAEADSLLSFAYSTPATAVAALDRWLGAQLAEARTSARAEAAAGKHAATASGFPYHRYEYDIDWTLAGRTPQLVSLAQRTWAFTGGAHGNSGTAGNV